MERLIVLDTETTGIDPAEGHRIIEIGAVEIQNREITDSEYHNYIQPERNVGDSVKIHGINDKFLVGKPKFEEIAQEFLEYIEGATLIIHNAPFDLGFLNNELKLIGSNQQIEDACAIIDTLTLSQKQRPGGLHNLDALCRRFEIDASTRSKHGALIDAQILSQVYLAMTSGQSALFADSEQIIAQKKHTTIRADADRAKIKIIRANKTEIKAHEQYFKHI